MIHNSLLNMVLALSVIATAPACGGADGAAAANAANLEALSAMLSDGTAPDGVTAETVAEGRTLFNTRAACAACHGANGEGGQLAPDLSDDQWLNADGSYEGILEVINAGVVEPRQYPGLMLPRGGMGLSDEEVNALAAFVWSLRIRG